MNNNTKIYDCFTFFNELDLLELRLHVLSDKVDYFVLVEATTTHSGKEKELYFEKNKARFAAFSDKIIHIVVDDMPALTDGNRWVLENFQRNAIMRGLSQCADEDIVFISDLDEIPNPEKIDAVKKQIQTHSCKNDFLYNKYILYRNWLSHFKGDSIILKYIRIVSNICAMKSRKLIVFQQNFYYYYLNGFIRSNWLGTRAVLYKDLVGQFHSSPQQIRDSLATTKIKNGGWHFSYLFSPADISSKLHSFAHKEFDKPEFTNIDVIQKKIESGENLFGRKDENIHYMQIDNSYPIYILENKEKYTSFIHKN